MQKQMGNINFYENSYDIIGQWFVRPGDKVVLGDMQNRICRFCGKQPPEVTFRKVAHAIPELLGNKSIESAYECDTCNQEFGSGIENDLGNWSKPMRTLIRIRGKSRASYSDSRKPAEDEEQQADDGDSGESQGVGLRQVIGLHGVVNGQGHGLGTPGDAAGEHEGDAELTHAFEA